jgi:hypothetical protein
MIRLMFSADLSMDPVQLFAGKGPFNFAISLLIIGLLMLATFLPLTIKFNSISKNVLFLSVLIFLLFILTQDVQGEFIYFQF